jgi:serine/threonine protein kinase
MIDLLPNYELQNKLYVECYVVVYMAVHRPTGEVVTIKGLVHFAEPEDGIFGWALRQVGILQSLNHPNTLRLRDEILTESHWYLVFDYMRASLHALLDHRGRPRFNDNPELWRSYAYQLLCAVYYLHIHRIIHHNITPSNILLDENGYLKLGGFGGSLIYSTPIPAARQVITDISYRAPEMFLNNDSYELEVDVWSAGCVIAEMTRGEKLFGDPVTQETLMHAVFQALGTPPADVLREFAGLRDGSVAVPVYPPSDSEELFGTSDLQLIDLCERLLALNPKRRITAKDALSHPYFNSVPEKIKELCYPKIGRLKL